MSSFDAEKYDKAKEIAIKFFEKNKKLRSPSLGDISFNSEGLMHLLYKNLKTKKKRDWKNQIKRFHLLQYVRPVLLGMKYAQEYSEGLESINIKKKGKSIIENKIVKYWAFVVIIEDKIRIKIILKKVGAGNIHFWSIIPIWKTTEYRDIKVVSLCKGNHKED